MLCQVIQKTGWLIQVTQYDKKKVISRQNAPIQLGNMSSKSLRHTRQVKFFSYPTVSFYHKFNAFLLYITSALYDITLKI